MTSTPPPPVFMTIATSSRLVSVIGKPESSTAWWAAATANCEKRAALFAAFGGNLAVLVARVEERDPLDAGDPRGQVRPELTGAVADGRDAPQTGDDSTDHQSVHLSRPGTRVMRQLPSTETNVHSAARSSSEKSWTTFARAVSPSKVTPSMRRKPSGTGSPSRARASASFEQSASTLEAR